MQPGPGDLQDASGDDRVERHAVAEEEDGVLRRPSGRGVDSPGVRRVGLGPLTGGRQLDSRLRSLRPRR